MFAGRKPQIWRMMGCLVAMAMSYAVAPAQQIGVTYSATAQTEAALKSLSPASQTVMERLEHLGSLPVGELRYHAGTLPDGASDALNDSSWETVQIPYTASADEVWLRERVRVPKSINGYDPTGAKLWLLGPTRGDVAVYVDGKRIARGEDMEPLVLLNPVKVGDQLLLAIHLGKTNEPKRLWRMEFRLDFAPNRPNPEVLRKELLSAALLVPSLAPERKSAVEQAIEAVNLKALDQGDSQAFDQSLEKSKHLLDALKPTLQSAIFHVTGNSHIDAAWLWPWTETVDVVKRTFDSAAQLMDEYPNYTYTQSAAQYNVWMAEKYPQLNERIKKRIKEGRWEIVGGMWVEPDLNMPDGESLTRQLLVGKRAYKQLYGIDVKIGWNPDSFGYNWQLPQIYKKSGIDYFVTQKMSWNETNQLPLKLFWWESPDGSKVLTYFPDGYGNTNFNPVRLSNDLLHARKLNPDLDNLMDLYGVGDHGGGPTRALLDEGDQWKAADRTIPKMSFGTGQSYFNDVQGRIASDSPTWNYETAAAGKTQLPNPPAGQISIPTWDDELYLEFHRGVFTTQSNHKRNMREAEIEVLNAEKYASLAWLDGLPYPGDQMTDAWKMVAFNQFHDLAAGSGIGVIYKDAQDDYDQVRRIANGVDTKSLHTLESRIDTRVAAANSVPLLIVNPLGWKRSGVVEANVQMPAATPSQVSVVNSQGRVLPSLIVSSDKKTNTYHLLIQAHDIPSLGYDVAHVVAGHRTFTSDLKASGTTLENSFLKVVVDPKTGCITSLYDKKTSFEALSKGSCGNALVTFTDKPKMFDAWNIDANFADSAKMLDTAESVKLVEDNPFRAVVRVTRSWQSSKFVQDIVLYNGSDEVDVVNDIDWHETHVLLKAAFELAATGPMATYEIPYGTIQRPTTRNNSWEKAKFEVPAIRWADLGDQQHGFSLINESKYGYDAVGHTLRLSLLRSPTDPDPNADRGHHHFSYALYPHGGDWKQALTVRRGYEFNYKLEALQVQAHAGFLPATHSFVEPDAQNVVLTAVKKAEDSNALIFRLYEWSGKDGDVRIRVPPGASKAQVDNLMEQLAGPSIPVEGGDTVRVPVHPYEIVTVQVDYPATTPATP